MKPIAILLILLCIAALVGVGYLYVTSNIVIEGYGCIAYETSQRPDFFDALKTGTVSDSFTETLFTDSEIGDPADYQFYDYTLRLRNNSFLKAEVIEIQVTPMSGDVAQLSASEEKHLSPRSSGDFSTAILTSREMHNIRELTVSYYLWGIPFSTRVTYRSDR